MASVHKKHLLTQLLFSIKVCVVTLQQFVDKNLVILIEIGISPENRNSCSRNLIFK